ncbi:MAG: hypothetical protein RLZZ540_285 [Bacteroidota bacterium]|jgi:hypothetical protein
MFIERIPTANGIDDIKLIGENDLENMFIKQLAEAGTLSCMNREVSNAALFRPISTLSDLERKESSESNIGKYDFSIRQNEFHNMDLTFIKDALPIDLTAFSAIKLQVKYSRSAPALLDFSIGSGLEIKGDDDNVLGVSFTADQTKSLNCQIYYYDVMMVKDGKNEYYLEGKITVKQSITR